MRRTAITTALVALPFVALVYWVASNTYWTEVKVPMPLEGEARVNPFYAAQRFAEALGARTAWDRVFTLPSRDSVVVLSGWHWSLSKRRREALEQWVEAGGRLVVELMLLGSDDDFERWSGITHRYRDFDAADEDESKVEPCRRFAEEHHGMRSGEPDAPRYWMCDFGQYSWLTSRKTPEWALRDESGLQALRVDVGRGSVTVINAMPFRYRGVFDGDHGWLFVAATQLRRDDEVRFMSEEDYPSLLALIWQHGAPVVVLTLALIALALWRNGVRFGPLVPPASAARRSLAEQIRGTGQFALRHGSGEALHAASVRALEEAGHRRVPGYARLSVKDRVDALARFTGFEASALAAALYHPRMRRSHELRDTIALLEAARRHVLFNTTTSSHGTH